MKKIIAWIVLSSKDPNKVSLMIKGVLTGVITYVVFFAGVFHLNIAEGDLKTLAESATKIVEVTLTFISLFMSTGGMIRKIYTTAIGTNKVIKEIKREDRKDGEY